MTHLECYLTKKGLLFGEIALRPPGGYLMNLIKIVYGFDPWKAFFEIESGKKASLSKRPKKVAASWIIHPGKGKIKKIKGLETLQKMGCDIKVQVKVGQEISKRLGTGESVGRILMEAPTKSSLMKFIRRIKKIFHIEMSA